MKKIFYLSLLAFAAAFTACTPSKSNKELLTGAWKGTYSEFKAACEFTLNEDGTGILDNMGVKHNIHWDTNGDSLFTAAEGVDVKSKTDRNVWLIKTLTEEDFVVDMQGEKILTFTMKKVK